jgi:hypothetical protein
MRRTLLKQHIPGAVENEDPHNPMRNAAIKRIGLRPPTDDVVQVVNECDVFHCVSISLSAILARVIPNANYRDFI